MKNKFVIIRSYYRNGDLADATSFLNDKKHGLENRYEEGSGKLRSQTVYIHGIASLFCSDSEQTIEPVFSDDGNYTIKAMEFTSKKWNHEGFGVCEVRGNDLSGISKIYEENNRSYSISTHLRSTQHGVCIMFKLKSDIVKINKKKQK